MLFGRSCSSALITALRNEYNNYIELTYISKSTTNTLMGILLSSKKCTYKLKLQNPEGHSFVDGMT